MCRHRSPRQRGFTLIELIVVMAVIALLVSIAAPRYFRSIDRAKENALRTSLNVLRDALDQFASDKGRYPESLVELVDSRYLRAVPEDAMTGSAKTWVIVTPPDASTPGKVYDIRSGVAGRDANGRLYADW
jgi:general secretion pathway protein G